MLGHGTFLGFNRISIHCSSFYDAKSPQRSSTPSDHQDQGRHHTDQNEHTDDWEERGDQTHRAIR